METTKKQRLASRSIRTLNWFFIGGCVSVQLHASNVITDWNSMASKTIVATAETPPPAAGVWFAYMSLAMYDAVNAITGQYQPVYYRTPGLFRRLYGRSSGRRRASRTRQLFSCAAVRLGRFFRNVDRGINGSPQAISDGKAIGEAATQAGISARARDGLLASISYT